MDITRRFRVIADIIQQAKVGNYGIDEIKEVLSSKGILRRTEIESLALLARELGFVKDYEERLVPTGAGLAFEQYMTILDEQELASAEPKIDIGTELRLCVTLPPRLIQDIKAKFGDSIADTLIGQRLVMDDCTGKLIIVSPFIDVSVLQLALSPMYSKDTDLVILTSDLNFTKKSQNYSHFQNPWLSKLENLIKNRFRRGQLFFLDELTTIAHAKVWACQKSAFITSANIKSDSTTENLEVGIYTDDPVLVGTLWSFLNFILHNGKMKCILDTL